MDIVLNRHLLNEELRARIYSGALVVRTRSSAGQAFAHAVAARVEAALGPNPQEAHLRLDADIFRDRLEPVKEAVARDNLFHQLLVDVACEFGFGDSDVVFNPARLRTSTPGDYLSQGVGYKYDAHRDTWYAAPQSQINIWIPIFSTDPENTLVFFPSYFSRGLANGSMAFDLEEWKAGGRSLAAAGARQDTRARPLTPQRPAPETEVRLALDAGEVLIFSGAHLHASGPNNSARTRFSIDFRLVQNSDHASGRGAPNVDNHSRGSTLDEFQPLPKVARPG